MKEWVRRPQNRLLAIVLSAFALGIVVLVIFNLVFIGRMLPGTYLDGVPVGGLTKTQALARVHDRALRYQNQILRIQYGKTVFSIPVSTLGAIYTDGAANTALDRSHKGGLAAQILESSRALMGRTAYFTGMKLSDVKLIPHIVQIDNEVTAPVANATLNFDNGITVNEARPGKRLDIGALTVAIEQAVGNMSTKVVSAPVYDLTPSILTDDLAAAKDQAASYASAPIELQIPAGNRSVSQAQIISWLDVTQQPQPTINNINLTSFYTLPMGKRVELQLSPAKISSYVAELAKSVDRPGQNAALSIQDGKAVVFQASRDGLSVDQAKTSIDIINLLKRQTGARRVVVTTKVTKPEINESSLSNLGINELISEGETFFPGSPSTRLQNVRAGAARFNGVLLKPDQVFSFGALLGDVGPAQGYVPELVILGDHEEKQYGGGLCQVSSTAFRAALQAGLPILERVNHSFAISYYTAPFGAPGVDATIFYPQVDFKFKNDTGHYILIQTIMQGTTLKFDFYGTKTKSGVIRGPQFVTGNNDATQPSHTVFWRDVLNLDGSVAKTDKFDTYYKSSKDFPITKQFN